MDRHRSSLAGHAAALFYVTALFQSTLAADLRSRYPDGFPGMRGLRRSLHGGLLPAKSMSTARSWMANW